MKSTHKIQYTIRNLEPKVDQRLRQKALETNRSLNEVVLEAVSRGIGLAEQRVVYHDLDLLAGSWKEDQKCEQAIREQDQIDPQMWK